MPHREDSFDDARGRDSGLPTSTLEPPPTPVDEPQRPRAGVSTVLVVGFAVALVAVTIVAAVGWGRAAQWERRADDRAEVIADLEQRATTSEGALTALEDRLDELASEKAGTEDEREAARLDAEQLEELVRQAGLVATDLDTCARGAVDVVELVNSLGDYDLVQVDEFVAEVQGVCSQALAENDALQSAIDALDAPAEPAPAPDGGG